MTVPAARLSRLASLLLLGGCSAHGLAMRAGGPAPVPSHPGLASSRSFFLQLYRGSPAGLLVGGLYPDAKVDPNRNPGTVIHQFTFTADPSVNGSYLWRFANGVTYLDGTCQKTDEAGLLAAAGRPGRNSAQFISFMYADQRNWAPPAVHVFSRSQNEPSDCSATVIADPAFANTAQ